MADPVVDPLANPANPAAATNSSSEDTVSIRFISPSWEGAGLPLLADLPVSTTIGQLKDRVQQEITTRGRSSQGMRLIYRGRVLDANEKTLEAIFGSNIESGAVAVHLVLRDGGENKSTPSPQQQQQQPQQHQHHHQQQQQQPSIFTVPLQNAAPTPTPAVPNQAQPFNQPQAVQAFHHHHHQAALNAHWAHHWAAVDSVRRGVPIATPNSTNLYYTPNANMPSGHPPSTHGSGYPPTGDIGHDQNEPTAAEIASMFTTGSSTSVQNHLAPGMAGLSHRPAFGAQQQGNPPGMPGSTVGASTTPEMYILASPSGQRWLLVHGNADAHLSPTPATGAVTGNTGSSTSGGWVPSTGHGTDEQVPLHTNLDERRLLQLRLEQQRYRSHQMMNLLQQSQRQHQQQHFDQGRQQLYQQYLQQQQQQQRVLQMQQQQRQRPVAPRPIFPRGHLRINNPGAGMLAAVVPHIWLIMRLLLFIWWFTSPDSSWTRWAMVILLATVMFLVNTGMLDSLANQVWAPIRHHLDGLIPGANDIGTDMTGAAPRGQVAAAAAPMTAENAVAGAGVRAEAGRTDAEPQPAQMAARLVGERRQANGERLMDMVRRAERVGIMFLASLAPGVAERHVALVEQRQAEAARRLQEQQEAARAAEEAATAAAAEAAAVPEGQESEHDGGVTDTRAGAAVETPAAEAVAVA